MGKKRITVIRKIPKKISKKEIISSPSHHFQIEINVLKELNKIVPKALQEVVESERKKLNQQKQALSGNDKKEFERFINWNKNPLTKQRHFATTSTTLRYIIGKTMELSVHSNYHDTFVKEMTLVNLITSFEEFLGDLLSRIYHVKPISLKGVSEQMSYYEIMDTKNLEDLKDKMIKKHIKILIRKGLDDLSKDLKLHFHLDLMSEKDYDKFKERFLRRNLLVHNSLYPDEMYRDLAKYRGKYTRLNITERYLKRSFSLFENYATKITDHMILKFS